VIKIILKIDLVYPYKTSLGTLIDFCNLWEGCLLSGGTNDNKSTISMSSKKFKKLFKVNPRIGRYDIPTGADYFMEKIEVIEIRTE
jgi:hypothetical protein